MKEEGHENKERPDNAKEAVQQKESVMRKDSGLGADDHPCPVEVQNGLAKSSESSSSASNQSCNDDGTNIKKGRDSEEDTAKDVNSLEESAENVSGQLNSIINCLEATKFVQLEDPDRHFWQMFSLKEEAAESLGSKQDTAMKLVSWTQKGLARVYPGNLRVDSSNFNPIPFWLR